MSKIYNSITELVGNTPLIKINNIIKSLNLKSDIYVKVESFNPLSSVKDRVALAIINDAEEKGILKKDTIIVEATSGNTGVGLAYVCASRGYHLIITMPETMSIERRKILSALGAELILTEGSKGMSGAIAKAEEIVKNNPNSFMADQFGNSSNPEIHRKTTAIEIYNDMDGKIDYFIAGVGTGGTITGVGEVLKEKVPNIRIVAVEPKSSAVLSGNPAGPHKLQGIGAGFIPKILNTEVYDEIVSVENESAFEASRLIAKKEGILVGISSGAALYAAIEIAKKEKGKKIVVLLPDTGERYLSTTLFE